LSSRCTKGLAMLRSSFLEDLGCGLSPMLLGNALLPPPDGFCPSRKTRSSPPCEFGKDLGIAADIYSDGALTIAHGQVTTISVQTV
jgi:hypothetical protein